MTNYNTFKKRKEKTFEFSQSSPLSQITVVFKGKAVNNSLPTTLGLGAALSRAAKREGVELLTVLTKSAKVGDKSIRSLSISREEPAKNNVLQLNFKFFISLFYRLSIKENISNLSALVSIQLVNIFPRVPNK